MKPIRVALLALLPLGMALPGQAQDFEVSAYTGWQTSPHSGVSTDVTADFTAGWEGRSFEMAPYYGVRGMVWQPSGWGFGVEFTHAKIYADDETLAESGFSTLEFTDGLNILTANALYRWDRPGRRWTPYAGAGIGLSIPYVEVEGNGVSVFEYQVTGPALRLVGGVSYAVSDRWSVFAEYNGTYSMNEADLGGASTLETDVVTNAINIGVSFNF